METFHIVVIAVLSVCAVILAAGFIHSINEMIRDNKNNNNPDREEEELEK